MIPHPTPGFFSRLIALLLAFALPAPADPVAPATNASAAVAPGDSITKATFGKIPHGPAVSLYTLTNKNGMSVGIMDYGATIVNLLAPDRTGKVDNVVLGFDRLAPYLTARDYFGATIGRYANRIAGGRFTIDKTLCTLARNDGPNALHGGLRGFDKRLWNFEAVDADSPAVRFTLLSKDGEEGYPGNLFVSVTFTLTEDNELRISYQATTDKPTVLNLTNHSCFNLAGAGNGTILNELLTLHANEYTPVDANAIPTGELKDVAGTPFDFTSPTALGLHLREVGNKPLGYDHNFVLKKGFFSDWALAATLDDPATGRRLDISTDQPGLQVYTANLLLGAPGKGHRHLPPYSGVALETQHYPDSPNHDNFPTTILRPYETFKSTTVYAFSAH